jgi:predicted transcriptional regulator
MVPPCVIILSELKDEAHHFTGGSCMDWKEARDQLLALLYQQWSERPPGDLKYGESCEAFSLSDRDAARLWSHWSESKYVEPLYTGDGDMHYGLTMPGVHMIERDKLAPAALIQENQRRRERIIEIVGGYTEQDSLPFFTKIAQEANLTRDQYDAVIRYLCDLDLLDHSSGHPRLTSEGLDALEQLRHQSDLLTRFRALSQQPPQARGRGLEELLERIIRQQGWKVERDVRPQAEQIDLVVSSDREWYMLECKWEQNPIDASVVRELHARLTKREGVWGCLLSMSGFTERNGGAVEEVRGFFSQRTILLFGPLDIEALVGGRRSFAEQLTEKLASARVRREVAFR